MNDDIADLLSDPDFVTDFKIRIAEGRREDDGTYIELLESYNKTGVIQPASGKDTRHLPDGDEYRHIINIWSDEYLSAVNRLCPQLGDIIVWNCKSFRLIAVEDWSQYGYWKAMATQLLEDKNGQ